MFLLLFSLCVVVFGEEIYPIYSVLTLLLFYFFDYSGNVVSLSELSIALD